MPSTPPASRGPSAEGEGDNNASLTPRGCMWFSRMRVQGHAGSEPLPPEGLDLLRQRLG